MAKFGPSSMACRCQGIAGGGIENYQGTLTVINCTVSGDAAIDFGSGIANVEGTLTVIDSSVWNNSALGLQDTESQGGGNR
jgi:hypothetical protein